MCDAYVLSISCQGPVWPEVCPRFRCLAPPLLAAMMEGELRSAQVPSLTVVQLRTQLLKRGQPTDGNKEPHPSQLVFELVGAAS